MVAVAGASLVGGVMGANASKSAANTQADASNRATQAQKDMFATQVGVQAPYRQMGLDAGSKLSYLLGLSPSGYTDPVATGQTPVSIPSSESGFPSGGSVPLNSIGTPGGMSRDAIRAELLPQFTQTTGGVPAQAQPPGVSDADWRAHQLMQQMSADPSGQQQPASSVDEAGLNAAIDQRMASAPQQTLQQFMQQGPNAIASNTAPAGASSAGAYGSLLKPFGTEDFQLDPGIQFQIQQGNQALVNSQAAKNGVLGGSSLKDLLAYNQQMAGTGYQSAFDRYMANKRFTLGSLMDTTNLGQAAASNATNGGATYSSGIANSITGAGNAQAAGAIGTANAVSGGLQGAGNMFLLSGLLGQGGSGAATPYNSFQSSPMSGLLYSNGSLGD